MPQLSLNNKDVLILADGSQLKKDPVIVYILYAKNPMTSAPFSRHPLKDNVFHYRLHLIKITILVAHTDCKVFTIA